MKFFIKLISNWESNERLERSTKISLEEFNTQIVTSLINLLKGENSIKSLSTLAFHLTMCRIPLVTFLSLFYMFTKGYIAHDVLVEGAISLYEQLSKLPFVGKIKTALTLSQWEDLIKISRSVKRKWKGLDWKIVDRGIFKRPEHELEYVPRSVSTLINKKNDKEYEKVTPIFLGEIVHQEVLVNKAAMSSGKEDTSLAEKEDILKTSGSNIFNAQKVGAIKIQNDSQDMIQEEKLIVENLALCNDKETSLNKRKGMKIDCLFITKARTSKQATGKWIKCTLELNQFTKEMVLHFFNNQTVVLNVENGYYTWKNNWIQFRLINGLKAVLRTKGALEIKDHLKIVQFAMDCKCHYFEDQ